MPGGTCRRGGNHGLTGAFAMPAPETVRKRPMKTAIIATLLAVGTLLPTFALAQGTVPVTEDLRRRERVEEAIDPRVAPRSSGAQAPVQSDPSGVAGFSGPPGGVGDSVGSYGALPQGATGANIR